MRWNCEVDKAIVSGVVKTEIQQIKPKIPPKPATPTEAAVYPKMSKIYRELNRQNEDFR